MALITPMSVWKFSEGSAADEIKAGPPFGIETGRVHDHSLQMFGSVGAWRRRGDNYGAGWQEQTHYRMADSAAAHFAKPDVQQWMRERLKERPDARFYVDLSRQTVAQSWNADEFFESANPIWRKTAAINNGEVWVAAKEERLAYADAQGQSLRPSAERVEVRGVEGLIGHTSPVESELFSWASAGPVPRPDESAPEFASRIGAHSPNCASCGDVLNERYDATVLHDGQRVHGSCAARLERIAAERPKPKAAAARDPYIAYRQDESPIAAAQASRDAGFVSRFKLDQVPEYQEHVSHPWHAEDVDDV